MNKILFSLFFSAVVIALASSCKDPQESTVVLDTIGVVVHRGIELRPSPDSIADTPGTDGVRLVLTTEDKQYLAIIDEKLIGKHFHDLKKMFPALKGIRPEDNNDNLAEQGFTESTMEVTLLGKKARVKFNFKNDSLYRFSIKLNDPVNGNAKHIFEGLITHYSDNFGDATQVPVEEDNHYFIIYKWSLASNRNEATITYDLNKGDIWWGISRKVTF